MVRKKLSDVTKKMKRQSDVWKIISSALVVAEEMTESEYVDTQFTLPEVDPVNSWQELINIYREELYLTPGNEAAIALCLAVTVSPYLPGEPIWLFLIGPPSSGKTTVIEAFGTSNLYCESQSQLHSKMLVSGWKSADGKDASFLPKLKKRTLLIKDYTTVVSMDHRSQEELYGILRDAFDGTFKKQFGNRLVRAFTDIKFGMIAGVTRVIHGDSRSSLGERFLKIEYLEDEEFDETKHIFAAMDSYHRKEERTKRLERSTLGYVDHLISNVPSSDSLPEVPRPFKENIVKLALLTSFLRAQVDRRGDDSLLYRPGKEIASRISVQMTKITQCLMLVLNKKEPDEEIYKILRKLSLDSSVPFNVEFTKVLYNNPAGISRADLVTELQLPQTNVHRICNDLLQLGIIQMRKSNNGKLSGRDKHVYCLHPTIYTLWDEAIVNHTDLSQESQPKVLPRRKRVPLKS